MPTVVPSVTEASEPASTPGLLQGRGRSPRAGADGVDGCFPTTSRPVSSSSTTRSVKVPPVSIPAWSATQLAPPYRGSQYSCEEPLAGGIAEVGALALGLRAPGAPEERPAAQPAGDGGDRAAPVEAQRPPLAHGSALQSTP